MPSRSKQTWCVVPSCQADCPPFDGYLWILRFVSLLPRASLSWGPDLVRAAPPPPACHCQSAAVVRWRLFSLRFADPQQKECVRGMFSTSPALPLPQVCLHLGCWSWFCRGWLRTPLSLQVRDLLSQDVLDAFARLCNSQQQSLFTSSSMKAKPEISVYDSVMTVKKWFSW